jgi:hypothetical protein
MKIVRTHFVALLFLFLLLSTHVRGIDKCNLPLLNNQHRNEATILRLENAWNFAFLTGDSDLERCLLLPGFTEIMRDGRILGLADELALAEQNKGHNPQPTAQPRITVLMHGNVAVAYGKSASTDSSGNRRNRLYAGFYVWEHGVWHVFFAQQTQSETGQ